jgi:hypothetical protein
MLTENREEPYFGYFVDQPAREIVFRVKLLLQNLSQGRARFKALSRQMSKAQRDLAEAVFSRIRIEVVVAPDLDTRAVRSRIRALSKNLIEMPLTFLTLHGIQAQVDHEYASLGDV